MISLNYVEIPSKDLAATKTFFSALLGWTFVDYGEDYTAFDDTNISGGFYKSNLVSLTENGATLLVLYTKELEKYKAKVIELGANIKQDIFSFPGGRRFHFLDPGGSEFAVWSDDNK